MCICACCVCVAYFSEYKGHFKHQQSTQNKICLSYTTMVKLMGIINRIDVGIS